MDRFRVEDVGKQSQGEILFDHKERPKTAAGETENRERIAGVIGRLLRLEGQE